MTVNQWEILARSGIYHKSPLNCQLVFR